jgi:hypothetical protein
VVALNRLSLLALAGLCSFVQGCMHRTVFARVPNPSHMVHAVMEQVDYTAYHIYVVAPHKNPSGDPAMVVFRVENDSPPSAPLLHWESDATLVVSCMNYQLGSFPRPTSSMAHVQVRGKVYKIRALSGERRYRIGRGT